MNNVEQEQALFSHKIPFQKQGGGKKRTQVACDINKCCKQPGGE